MNNKIFILTNSAEREAMITRYISNIYEVYTINKNELMVKLYNNNPEVIIVDLDSFTMDALEMIKSILTISYIPVIYIYEEKYITKKSIVGEEIAISLDKVDENVNFLIKQSVLFKKRYNEIMESYDAIDLLNVEAKGLLNKYINSEKNTKNTVINKLLNLVFGENIFLSNKPKYIWILSSEIQGYKGTMFGVKNNELNEEANINFSKEDRFSFDVDASNGFYKNFNDNELSDIASTDKIFPKAMRNYTKEINNFAGFSMDGFIFIGVNYNNNVTNYDVAIMKAVTINLDLMESIKLQMNEMEQSFEYTTNALARAAEANDDSTGQHIKRVNIFSKRLAEEIGMSKDFVTKISSAAQMHDVGKIYVDKSILTKPGKLTDEEFEHIKNHTVYGEKIIGSSEYLRMSCEIARNHHERYDGTGYPDGKKGQEIPIAARIVFLADIYDALRSERPYKPGFTHEEAYDIITRGDGRVEPRFFDPIVLEAFKKIHVELKHIYDELKGVE